MKVAILGNTANNGFSIMRYFRDLGADAHLLLYTTDGVGPNAHFRPENDTHDFTAWDRFVHQTRIANFPVAAMNRPFSTVVSFSHAVYRRARSERFPTPSISDSAIHATLSPYDRIVGSGIAPAVCARIGRRLDIFYPYAIGVEWLGDSSFEERYGRLKPLVSRTRQLQRLGIQAARHVVNWDMGKANQVFLENGVTPKNLPIPMLYNRESVEQGAINATLDRLKKWLMDRDFCIFSSARMIWTPKSARLCGGAKNNHYALFALKKLKQLRPTFNFGMVLCEYGPDVSATKELIKELCLESEVYWMEKSGRRTLLSALGLCDVAVGQFYSQRNLIWGATGWEALATGRPFLQGFLFDEGGFEQLFDMPPPPMLPVQAEEDILTHLLDMVDYPEKRKAIGEGAKEWFDRYNGIGLAKKWLDLLLDGETA